MGTQLRRFISSLLAVTIALGFVVFDKKDARAAVIKEIDLYSTSSDSPVSVPGNYRKSYQITLADLGLTKGEISSYSVLFRQPDGILYEDYNFAAVNVSNTGLVTTACWYWNNGIGYSNPPEDWDYTRTTPITGTATVRVYLKDYTHYDITFHHIDYDAVYADKVIDDFVAKNITSDMSVKDIVTAATKWAAESFDYGNISSAYSMIIYGYGDCWASTDLICQVCTKCGLKAWARNGNKDLGAGSGHMNAMVEDKANGVWYVGEAGYSGKAPRKYSVRTRTSLYCYRTLTSENNAVELYQIDADNETYNKTTSIRIPSKIEGYTVTSLGANFIAGNTVVNHVIIPDTVRNLGNGAFYNCSSLSSIDIPSGVTTIGAGVFGYCTSLKTVKIPSSVTSIGNEAFFGCEKLTDIYFEGSESDWKKISIGSDNDVLSNVTFHYGTSPKTGWTKTSDGKWTYYDLGSLATGLHEVDNSMYYFDASGIMQTGWQQIDSFWYYFKASGKMLTGWQYLGNYWYYLDYTGKMLKGFQKINGSCYYFSETGEMATGWKEINYGWFYFGTSGNMQTGWQKIGNKWYFFENTGRMITGWENLSGSWFYFDTDGCMATSWKLIDGKWYYFGSNGYMVNGWQMIGNKWYVFNKSGYMLTGWYNSSGNWYYLAETGEMVTGWKQIGGNWYRFDNSGKMTTGWYFTGGDWYYMNGQGVMVTGTQTINGKEYVFDSTGICTNP